jgi:glycosyltransferase involved in cell wall biosynthesis
MDKAVPGPRVLHVAQPVVDGVAVVVADLAEYLAGHSMQVAVACPAHGYLPDRLRSSGIEHLDWEAGREPGRSTVGETRALARLIAGYKPDVVHLHSSKAGLAGRLAMRGRRPTVFSPHAWSFYHLSGAMRTVALTWERVGARWTDVVLCGSVEEAQVGEELGIHGRYEVIPNISGIADPGLSRTDARRLLNLPIPDDAPLAVCLGRFTRQKGQDVMVQAWPQIRRAVPQAHLALVGQGVDEQMLREMAPPDVIFGALPRRDSVAEWMLAADVLVFPSRWETLSLAVLEALQLNRVVVVSDCGGMREALEGGAGTMVPADDVASLAEAVTAYLRDREHADAEGRRAGAAYRRVHAPQKLARRQRYRDLLVSLA